MKPKPIKRHKALQGISRDHHHSLLLCWKIRSGLSKGVSPERIKRYADWMFSEHILPHFKLEEKYMFPVLEADDPLVKKALSEHRRLTRLFNDTKDLTKALGLIEEELEQHIRFEERVVFQEIQKVAGPEQLEQIDKAHDHERFQDNEQDPFWT